MQPGYIQTHDNSVPVCSTLYIYVTHAKQYDDSEGRGWRTKLYSEGLVAGMNIYTVRGTSCQVNVLYYAMTSSKPQPWLNGI